MLGQKLYLLLSSGICPGICWGKSVRCVAHDRTIYDSCRTGSMCIQTRREGRTLDLSLMMDSDSDFKPDDRRRAASICLAINQPRRYIKRARTLRESREFAGKLAERFSPCCPGPSQSPNVRRKKPRKVQQFNFIPVCVRSPLTVTVPTKGVLDHLCKLGLGSKWFCNEQYLDASAEELHFLLLCLFLPLMDIPYEICKHLVLESPCLLIMRPFILGRRLLFTCVWR